MSDTFTDAELEAYIDESLDPQRAAELETHLKTNPKLIDKLAYINGRRDAGVHTLGEIWRRHQIGVPSRDILRDYLADRLPPGARDYVQFRIEILKCRFTVAHLADLRRQQSSENQPDANQRRSKIFESGEKLLAKRKKKST